MKLPDDERAEYVHDGKDESRRAIFRAITPVPLTFEKYLAALEELLLVYPAPPPSAPVIYEHPRL